ncbi:hypothetical protein GXW82_10370 [Streptacidiphilus sp. 4-A2]|nr:hypothetical protein [Streptacidiphilus sp. 4-A2]
MRAVLTCAVLGSTAALPAVSATAAAVPAPAGAAPANTPSAGPSGTSTASSVKPSTDASAWLNSVGNSWPDYWKLSFAAWTASSITGVTAHYVPVGAAAGTPDAGTSTAFVQNPSTPSGWVSSSEVSLPHLGVYEVSFDVTESDGDVDHFADAGTFTYAAKVHVGALTASRSFVTYQNRTYTITAPVTVTDPSTGATLDPTGIPVTVSDPDNPLDPGRATPSAPTDGSPSRTPRRAAPASGSVSPTRPAGRPPRTRTPSTVRTPARSRCRPRPTPPASGCSPHRRAARRRRPDRDPGVLEYQENGVWAPAPGQGIDSGAGGCGGGSTVTTAADGTFALSVNTAGAYYFCNYWDYNPFLADSDTNSSPVVVHIPVPTAISRFSVSEDAYGEAAVDGYLTGGDWGVGQAWVMLQYSPDGRTWHNVGWTQVGRTNLAYQEFAAYATYGSQSNGYWRAYYEGGADYQPAYSKAVKIYRAPTRVTGGRPSQTHVGRNGWVSFSGHVQQRLTSGVWATERGGSVTLVFRPYGSSSWYAMAKAGLNSSGGYSLGSRAPLGGTWAVVWLTPDNGHIDATGPQSYVYA